MLLQKIISLFALSLVEHGDHSQMEPSSSRLKERLTSKSYGKRGETYTRFDTQVALFLAGNYMHLTFSS